MYFFSIPRDRLNFYIELWWSVIAGQYAPQVILARLEREGKMKARGVDY
jgi:hypothetical protein